MALSKKQIFLNSAIFLIVTIIWVVIGLEILLSIFPSLMPLSVRYMVSLPSDWHPVVGVIQRPGIHNVLSGKEFTFHVDTNDLGFKGIGFRDIYSNKEKKIVVVGDSFTWGVGVEKPSTWTESLEKRTGAELIDMSYCGYGTVQERLILENWGIKLKPVGVIAQVTYNDLLDNEEWSSRFSINRGPAISTVMKVRSWLFKNSRTYELFKYYILGALLHRGAYADLFDVNSRYKEVSFGSARLNIPVSFTSPENNGSLGKGWRIMQQELVRMKNISENNSAWMAVVLIPTKEYVYSKIYSLSDKSADLFNDKIDAFCKTNGIYFFDTTPALRQHATEQIYWKDDGHLTARGHEVISDFLEKEFKELKL